MPGEIRRAFLVAKTCVVGTYRLARWIVKVIVWLHGTWLLWNRESLRCPGCGVEVALHGYFQCEWCNQRFLGHAFAPCPTPGCGAVPPCVPCPRCQCSVYNPAFYGS